MKILVDQNISFRLVAHLTDAFSEVEHIKAFDLIDSNDYQIFMFARQQGYSAVLTQDEDFYSLLLEHGTPPKVIWLRVGNCSTMFLSEVILRNAGIIESFLKETGQDCLEIYS